MATLVVGDVHGSYRTLKSLLKKAGFDESRDRLWMVGDLVNRGSDSLGVLRWAHERSGSMGPRFVSVLGNHDLHLLALDAGIGKAEGGDLRSILKASDRRTLITWLRSRPMLHREKIAGEQAVLVHAGLWPGWTLKRAGRWAERVGEHLRDPRHGHELMLGPKALSNAPGRLRRLGEALYAFTSLRTLKLDRDQIPCRHKGPPADTPAGCVPWFEAPGRRWRGPRIFFGHWAALGLFRGKDVTGLDSGCAWGGPLTAVRIEDGRVFQARKHPKDVSNAM